MTEYRKKSDGTLLTSDSQFRSLFPNTSFPKHLTEGIINDFGYDLVYEGIQPSVTPPYQRRERDGLEEIDSKWYTKYKVVTLDEDGKTAYDNEMAGYKREERNELLKDSDWTQTVDKSGLADSKVTEWATYRQSLRDLPTASGWPHTHTLPTKPS